MISPPNWEYERQGTAYPECESVTEIVRLVVQGLDNHRDSLPSADARRRQPIPQSISLQLIQNCNHQPCPRSPQRMPERDRSAVHICLIALQPEHLFHGKVLRGERLIHFYAIHLVQRES